MTQRIFPIKSEPACLLKWCWSTIFFNSGSSASCHRTEKYAIDPTKFDQFHNLPEKLRDRTAMLEGKWPGHGCEYCRDVEQVAGYSDRQMHLDAQQDPGLTPPELSDNSICTEVTPTILEVYFNNTCNMKCIYCGPHFSSLWEQENRKFGKSFGANNIKFSVRQEQHNPHYQQMVNDLWKYLDDKDRFKSLRRFHVLGGEPFIIPEIENCIEFWKTHPNPDLVLSVISNLNVPHERFKSYIDRFEQLALTNKIWKLQLTASLDAWGKEQEYTRFGLNLDLWRTNFEYVLNKPGISPSINSALSALTIKQMPTLLNMINHWNTYQTATVGHLYAEPIQHSFNTTGAQDEPFIFGPSVFKNDFDQILSLMPEDTDVQRSQKSAMHGIATRMSKSGIDANQIKKLTAYLDELDHRRGTDWRILFPWLNQDFVL
jgi:hypothetical protein